MKKVRVIVLFCCINMVCFSQNPMNEEFKKHNLPENEEHIDYYRNGKLKFKYTRKNGNLEGEYLHYFKNGQVDDSSYFENGHYDGTNMLYNRKGSWAREERFKHDTLLFIKETRYYKNRKIYYERYLSFDMDSLRTFPFSNYNVALLRPRLNWDVNLSVKNIKSTGKYIEYYKNGQLAEESILINSMVEGVDKGYYDDGSLYYEGTYHKNKEDGVFTYYTAKGEITKIETWKEGKKIKTEKKK